MRHDMNAFEGLENFTEMWGKTSEVTRGLAGSIYPATMLKNRQHSDFNEEDLPFERAGFGAGMGILALLAATIPETRELIPAVLAFTYGTDFLAYGKEAYQEIKKGVSKVSKYLNDAGKEMINPQTGIIGLAAYDPFES